MDNALTPDRLLEAHLCRPVVQSDPKVQPAIRTQRDYYTRQLHLRLLSQRGGEADLRGVVSS